MKLARHWSGAVGFACAIVSGSLARGEVIGHTTNALIQHNTELPTMAQASADLVADGHTLVPVNALNSQADLAGIDRLVVGVISPNQVLSGAQMDVVEAFVNDGGKLIYLGENWAFFNINTAVGGRFGIVYPNNSNPPETVLTDIKTHPITSGPFGVVATLDGSFNQSGAFGSMSSPGPNGISIVNFPGGHSAAVVIEPNAHAPGSGLVVAYSDINPWHDNGYLDGDNRALWRNTFAYCPTQGGNCPWDCDDGNGDVGITDFLALLAQWGGPGSCDIDGGGVGINDFLEMLANWGPCPDKGTCCFLDGSCVELTFADCGTQGGVYNGNGSTCAANPCPPVGACCWGNGCSLSFPGLCFLGGAVFHEGSGCEPDPCDGACCFCTGDCQELDEVTCQGMGGTYAGSMNECADINCGPSGACCLDGGGCSISQQLPCTLGGGTYQGDCTSCASCP